MPKTATRTLKTLTLNYTLCIRFNLYMADKCFLTGTGAEIMPVTMIDGRTIGDGRPGTLTGRLIKSYRKLVMAEAA